MVVDESYPRCSLATDIAAVVADQGFDSLRAPIRRVTAPHAPVPFSPPLEDLYIPSAERVADECRSLVRYAAHQSMITRRVGSENAMTIRVGYVGVHIATYYAEEHGQFERARTRPGRTGRRARLRVRTGQGRRHGRRRSGRDGPRARRPAPGLPDRSDRGVLDGRCAPAVRRARSSTRDLGDPRAGRRRRHAAQLVRERRDLRLHAPPVLSRAQAVQVVLRPRRGSLVQAPPGGHGRRSAGSTFPRHGPGLVDRRSRAGLREPAVRPARPRSPAPRCEGDSARAARPRRDRPSIQRRRRAISRRSHGRCGASRPRSG